MIKTFPRWIEQKIVGSRSKDKVRLVFGARQTGKSTLLRRIAATNAIMINLQDRRQRQRFERQTDELVNMLRAERRHRMVLIDEIQRVPALLDDIQLLYDENPHRFDFILTGSSARKLRVTSANLLPGRVHQYHLFPLIAIERKAPLRSVLLPVASSSTWQPGFPSADIKEMLIYGSLPGVVMEPVSTRQATLETYAEIYLEEEIRREALVRNIGPFAQFLELAALEGGREMNLTGLSQQSGVPIATLRSFYQVLVDTFVGFWVGPFTFRSRKRLLTTPRFYFFDVGVRNALARLPLNRELIRLQAGELFHQWVVTELWHRCQYLGRGYRLAFWRTVSGAEVDLVLQTPKEVIPIEIKWTDTPRYTDARHLKTFLEIYPKEAKRGFIICRAPHRLELTKHITAIPWQEI